MIELTADKVIVTVTTVTEYDRVVSFDDILDSVRIENDDWPGETPWESCDGWDHTTRNTRYDDHDDISESRGYVRGSWNSPTSLITIDDDDITNKWGCNGYHGASKQVRAEIIAQVKRNALDQLVKWYEDGWSWWAVCGEYNGYTGSCGGIDCYEYAEEMRSEIAEEIAGQMEDDGYIVEDRPESIPYNPAKANRENHAVTMAHYIVHAR